MSRAIMPPAKWGDRRSVKEAAMKTMALLFLLSVSALAVAAQSPNVDQSTVALRKAPDDLLKTINSGRNKNEIQLLHIEYANGSAWNRP